MECIWNVMSMLFMCVLAADDDEEEFVLTVRYCGRDVLQRTVCSRTGCRLCYDQSHIVHGLDDFLPNEFGQAVLSDKLLVT